MTAFFIFFLSRTFFGALGARENGLGARPNFLYAGKTLCNGPVLLLVGVGEKNRFFDFSRFSLERFCLDSEKFIIDFLIKKKKKNLNFFFFFFLDRKRCC